MRVGARPHTWGIALRFVPTVVTTATPAQPRKRTGAVSRAATELTLVERRRSLVSRFHDVRAATARLTATLEVEDYVIQTMPDVSPTKWHLGHTSWFFEQFLLIDGPAASGDYRPFHPRFNYLFNSYYVTVGDRHCRIKRGTLGRPTVAEVFRYRAHVDEQIVGLIERADEPQLAQIAPLLEIGLNHEQQHQELACTDLKHVFSCNPLYPVYRERSALPSVGVPAMTFVPFEAGLREVGHDGGGFAYDNEGPRHKVYLNAFELADRLVTNGEFLEFLESGGYANVPLWLSAGAATVAGDPVNWSQPFYWQKHEGAWHEFTLAGLRPLNPDEPVCHLSYFEADAYARWKGCRLPTEFEWEVACVEGACAPDDGNFVEDETFHPAPRGRSQLPTPNSQPLAQMFGNVWEWTASQYTPYPGYRAPPGALGEYNGKFMCNQFVLRGGSCVTPRAHIRATYRNFFPPDARWQFTGLRLARDA